VFTGVRSCVQAEKVEDLVKGDYEEEIKRRSKRIFIPNWFTVDLKTGVNQLPVCLHCSVILK